MEYWSEEEIISENEEENRIEGKCSDNGDSGSFNEESFSDNSIDSGREIEKQEEEETPEHRIREEVAREILSTEISYVKNLMSLIHGYMKPFKDAEMYNTECNIIFGNVELIFEFHKHILSKFRERFERWNSNPVLGDVFIQTVSDFKKVYSPYFEQYEQGCNLLRKVKQENEKFSQLLKDCNQRSGMGDISNLLILPIQRIPRYELLLTELLKHTEPNHPDFENLKKAIESIKKLANFVDSKAQQASNKQNYFNINEIFRQDLQDLLLPYRQWVHTGILYETKTKDGKNIKKRKCFLFNDLLVLTSSKRNKKLYIKLGCCWITDFPPIANSFQVITDGDTHVMIAEDKSKQKFWMDTITKCIQDWQAESAQLRKERSKYKLYEDPSRPDLWRVTLQNTKRETIMALQPDITSRVAPKRTPSIQMLVSLNTFQDDKGEEDTNLDEKTLRYDSQKGWQLTDESKDPNDLKLVDWRKSIKHEFDQLDVLGVKLKGGKFSNLRKKFPSLRKKNSKK